MDGLIQNKEDEMLREKESLLKANKRTVASMDLVSFEATGLLVFKGNEICGLAPYPSLNVVHETTLAREHDAAFPKLMYVISSLHIDGILILQNEKGEIFQYIPKQYTKKIYNSLAEYLQSL